MDLRGFKQIFLDRGKNKRKTDKNQEIKSLGDDKQVFDVLRSQINAQATKKTEVATAKPSQDKAQQRDVASSSGLNKIGDIPENFKLIDGNEDLINAKVILLGECHIPQHNEVIVKFINTHVQDGDIVLVEGIQAGRKLSPTQYALEQAFNLETVNRDQILQAIKENKLNKEYVNKLIEEGMVIPLKKGIKIYGWDNIEMCEKQQRIYQMRKGWLSENFLKTQSIEIREVEKELFEVKNVRNESMLTTINKMRTDFPNKKLFIIAGKAHCKDPIILENLKKQSYIALTPKYKITKEDKENYTRRENEYWKITTQHSSNLHVSR